MYVESQEEIRECSNLPIQTLCWKDIHSFLNICRDYTMAKCMSPPPLRNEKLAIPVSTKPDNYKVVCIK